MPALHWPPDHAPPSPGSGRVFLLGASLLLVLCGFLFFHDLARRDLWSSHEARAAQDAQTLLDNGFATMPRLFDGRVEMQKPPLYYWMTAVIAWADNGTVDAWSVRLPSAVAGLAVVLGLFTFCARRGRVVAGLVSAAILATAVHFTWLARTGRIDMPLTLTTAMTLWAFATGRGRWWIQAIGYVALSGGVLLKGPIGAALPVAAAGACLLVNRQLPAPWRLRAWGRLVHDLGLWWGIPLVVLLVAPVYAWADARTEGDFFRVFLWHHNLHRGFGGSDLLRSHPWWFYVARFLVDFLPWSIAFPFGLWLMKRRGLWRADAELRFGLVWFVAIGLLLSLMRFKRADYLLPAYPGAALFLGCLAEHVWETATTRSRLKGAFAGLLLLNVVGWWGFLRFELHAREPEREHARFAAEVRRLHPSPRPVLFFRTEAHTLAFHVGRPLQVFVEWDRLEAWTEGAETVYVVMPPEVAREWPRHLPPDRLEEVLRNTNLPGAINHEEPLVLLRTRPVAENQPRE